MPNERYGSSTFDTLARIVAQSPTEAAQRLYKLTHTGSRIDVIRSDGAVGWRIHVTKHGEGIRLMFWRLTDSSIEFANVGPKSDVNIQ